jgi:hypothetical protein
MYRDRSLDVLRGLFLIIITIEHFGGALRVFTWQIFGFVYAAEGFIFLSGYMSGLVYGRPDRPHVTAGCLRRALQIYGFHLGLVLCLVGISVFSSFYAEYWRGYVPLYAESPLAGLGLSALLLYNPNYLSILPLYAVFLVLTPLLLQGHRRGWSGAILAASLLLWWGGQQGLRDALLGLLPLPRDQMMPGLFDLTAWQLLFVAGNWLGYRRAMGQPLQLPGSPTLQALAGAGVVLLMAWRLGWLPMPALVEAGHDRHTLEWVRLLNFILVGYLFMRLVRPRAWFINLDFPARLGRNSLEVYSWSILAIFLAMPLSWRAHAAGPLVDSLATLAFIGLLLLPVWLKPRVRHITRGLRPAVEKS